MCDKLLREQALGKQLTKTGPLSHNTNIPLGKTGSGRRLQKAEPVEMQRLLMIMIKQTVWQKKPLREMARKRYIFIPMMPLETGYQSMGTAKRQSMPTTAGTSL